VGSPEALYLRFRLELSATLFVGYDYHHDARSPGRVFRSRHRVGVSRSVSEKEVSRQSSIRLVEQNFALFSKELVDLALEIGGHSHQVIICGRSECTHGFPKRDFSNPRILHMWCQ